MGFWFHRNDQVANVNKVENALASQLKAKKLEIKQMAAQKLVLEKQKAEALAQQKQATSLIESEFDLFKNAVKHARPLESKDTLQHAPTRPKPIPQQFIRDEKQALVDSLSDGYISPHDIETGEELLYLREGQSPSILSKLRRGFWVIQAQIDLHGLISDEARAYVAAFIADCKKNNIRCVRIVHGKGLGSRNREPILKHKLRNWLMQKDEVIAYAQAKPEDGGSGAVIVLLKT